MTTPADGPRITAATTADRDDAAAFAGRVARWDPLSPVRIRQDGDFVRLWATTPFEALVMRAFTGRVDPADVTVYAGNLLAGLAVSRGDAVDPGPRADALWRSQLPPLNGWVKVDDVPAELVNRLADDGVRSARERPGPAGAASTALLDSEVMSVQGSGMSVSIPMRMVFALSGMSFAPSQPEELVRISATDSWVRIDARYGTVLRRRHALLPLLF